MTQRFLRTSPRAFYTLLYGNVGALQLLRSAGHSHPLHDGEGHHGGMGLSTADAGVIYGLTTAMVYMAALPGGWIADQFLGLRKAVLLGEFSSRSETYASSFPQQPAFYCGLALIVAGTGLLKPNVSAIVGSTVSGDGHTSRCRILDLLHGYQHGALLAPLLCGGWRSITGDTDLVWRGLG